VNVQTEWARVTQVVHALDLPEEWDSLADSLLQTRSLLRHYEETNPCRQRYHVLWTEGRPVAGAVVYSITQNLLTFLGNVPSPVHLNVVGLPASVPPGGIVGPPAAAAQLLAEVFAAELGLTVALNLPRGLDVPGTISLRMLPDMILRRSFPDLDAYRNSLRADWRRRMIRSEKRFADVTIHRTSCAAFTSRHHRLYLDVLAHASERLETLSPAFFRGLPPPLELVSCCQGGKLLCWRIVLAERDRLIFVLGAGAREIDLGQTAEDAQARLGALPAETCMLLHHPNRLVDLPLRIASPLIAYRGHPRSYRIFRREDRPS